MFYFIFLNFIKKFIFRTQIFEKVFLFFILLYIYIYEKSDYGDTNKYYICSPICSPITMISSFQQIHFVLIVHLKVEKKVWCRLILLLFFKHPCSSKSIDALEFHSLYFIYFVLLITSYSNKHIAIAFNGVGQDSNSIKIHIQCLY